MGLWGNIGDRISGVLCKDVIGNLLKLPKLPVNLPVTVPNVGTLPSMKLPVVNGLLGAQAHTDAPKVVQVTRPVTATSNRRPGGLGSLFNRL